MSRSHPTETALWLTSRKGTKSGWGRCERERERRTSYDHQGGEGRKGPVGHYRDGLIDSIAVLVALVISRNGPNPYKWRLYFPAVDFF